MSISSVSLKLDKVARNFWRSRRSRKASQYFQMKLETCRVDTDVRSSQVVPCVELIAESPWDGVSSTALAFSCCHHGVRSRHCRHEGAARAAGTLDRQLTFSSPAAYSCDFQPAQNATRFSGA